MDTDDVCRRRGQVVFVGNKGSGKTSLYQCLKSPNPQVVDLPSCSVLVEEWKPFDLETSPVAEECRKYLDQRLSEEDLKATVQVWDICGHEPLWTCQQLCISNGALFVLVCNVRNPNDAKCLPQWVQMIQAKSIGANIIIAASNSESFDGSLENILEEIEKVEREVVNHIEEEITALKELNLDPWVQSRIEKLTKIAHNRPKVFSTVILTSAVTGKGLGDLRCAILDHLFDTDKFPHFGQSLSPEERDLIERIGCCHNGKNMVMSMGDYAELASAVGLDDERELENVTETLEVKGFLARVNVPSTFHDQDTTVVITDPCCFACACALIHRDEENPQDFVSNIQKSQLVQRFWPTSTRPNDWTLRSAVDDVVSKGMMRESFLPLCWQMWDVDEGDIKRLLPVMLKLGILNYGAPKAGYEIELALSYFKNLSVTKRYHLPLLLKLPKQPPGGVWPDKTPESTVSVGWRYKFYEGFNQGLMFCILAACKNYRSEKTVLGHWQNGLIVRVGDVDVRVVSEDCVLDLSARCKITNGNKQALTMSWLTLADFLYVTESYLSNFPGLFYQFLSPFNANTSPKSIYHSIQEYISESESPLETLWILPPLDFNSNNNQFSLPFDVQTWFQDLSGQSSIYISHQRSHNDEVKLLAISLEQSGFKVAVQEESKPSDLQIQKCSLVIFFLTKSYLEDPSFQEDIKLAETNNIHIVIARFDQDLTTELANVVWVDLDCGSGAGISHTFDPDQLNSLVTECRTLVYSSGEIEPFPEHLSEPEKEHSEPENEQLEPENEQLEPENEQLEPENEQLEPEKEHFEPEKEQLEPEREQLVPLSASSIEPTMDPRKSPEGSSKEKSSKKAEKKKRQVQFSPDTDKNHVGAQDDQVKPLAACTVAAAMVGAAAEHLSLTRKASSAGVRAAGATAKVARAVASGDADAATEAMNDVVKIVDSLSSSAKQENGFGPPPKSKTCAIL